MDPLLGVARAEREVALLRAQLQGRADREEQARFKSLLAVANAAVESARVRLEETQREFGILSYEVEQLRARMDTLGQQEEGSDYRQLSHLGDEQARVREQIEEMEESQLVALEEGEVAERDYDRAVEEREGVKRFVDEAHRNREDRLARVNLALEEALLVHEAEIGKLDSALSEDYRRHVQVGRATSILHGSVCGNCDLSLSTRLVSAVAKAPTLSWSARPRCEECGCVLVAEEGL